MQAIEMNIPFDQEMAIRNYEDDNNWTNACSPSKSELTELVDQILQKYHQYYIENKNYLAKIKYLNNYQKQLKNNNQIKQLNNENCENCNQKIVGIQYACIVCSHYYLCENCEKITTHQHPFLKIKNALQQELIPLSKQNLNQSSPLNFSQKIQQFKQTQQQQQQQQQPNQNFTNFKDSLYSSVSFQGVEKPKANLINPMQSYINNFEMPKDCTQSMYIQFTKKPEETKKVRYIARITTLSAKPEIEIIAGKFFKLELLFQNSGNQEIFKGDQDWPQNVIFKCLEGFYVGTSQEIPSLKLNEETTISITFKAPLKPQKYFTK